MLSVDATTISASPREPQAQARGLPPPARARLRKVVDQVIGVTFFQPLLKTGRNSALKRTTPENAPTLGRGGRGEDVFGAQLDLILAERAGGATKYDLSTTLVNRFGRTAETHAQQSPKRQRGGLNPARTFVA